MFGIGYQEMFVILVIALVVFGPHRLPEIAGQVGRWVRQFRSMTADLTGEFEKTIAEVEEIKETVRREMKGVMDEVDDVGKSVRKDLAGTKAIGSGSTSSRTGARKPTPSTSRATNGRTALPRATRKDPLSDVSAMDDLLTGPVTPRPASNGTGNGHIDGAANGAAATAEGDALARVRRRRAAAGYSRTA
jgi:Tat protein translocase TatB subunit